MIIILIHLLLFGFLSHNANFDCTTYVDSDNVTQITLCSDGTFQIEHTPAEMDRGGVAWRLQDLGFGTWRRENGFLVLRSAAEIESRTLPVHVTEGSDSRSTVRVRVLSPYDSLRLERRTPLFRCTVTIQTSRRFLTEESCGDTIEMGLNDNEKLVALYMYMIPDAGAYPGDLSFNFLRTEYYRIQSRTANVFDVYVPRFTLEYIGYWRFSDDYFKIGEDGVLLLRGKRYAER